MIASPPLPRLVLRADGNARIGLGHAMRLLALAHTLCDCFAECVFATRDAATLEPLLAATGLAVQPLPALSLPAEADWLRTHLLRPTDVLALDGYDFGATYQAALRPGVGRLVYVDDLRTGPVVADVLLNPSPGVVPAMYPDRRPDTQLLLGPAYSLLRPPFVAAASLPRPAQPLARVLLCFGGADPLRLTARCLPLLLAQPELQTIGVLVGAANPDGTALRHLVATQAPRATWHPPATAAELVPLLHSYDGLVCPASTILVEALVLGMPALTGYYVPNQQHLATFVGTHGQAYSVGNFAALTDAQLAGQLVQGLQALACTPRQTYGLPQPAALRAVVAAPLPGAARRMA